MFIDQREYSKTILESDRNGVKSTKQKQNKKIKCFAESDDHGGKN